MEHQSSRVTNLIVGKRVPVVLFLTTATLSFINLLGGKSTTGDTQRTFCLVLNSVCGLLILFLVVAHIFTVDNFDILPTACYVISIIAIIILGRWWFQLQDELFLVYLPLQVVMGIYLAATLLDIYRRPESERRQILNGIKSAICALAQFNIVDLLRAIQLPPDRSLLVPGSDDQVGQL